MRQSARVGFKVKRKTLAVLTHLPVHVLAAVQRARPHKHQALQATVRQANAYLAAHPRAHLATQQKRLAARMATLQVQDWLQLSVSQGRLVLSLDASALQAAEQLDGCYVVETDLSPTQADAQTVHDRYKDLALVEQDFRTLKTGHLHLRPWFGCTPDNTQAHALTAMLALKVRRDLERAWQGLDLTVEEGLRQLQPLCVMDLIDWASGRVLARQLPQLHALQQQLLEVLGLSLPCRVPEARVSVVTRKEISLVRKPIEK